MATYDTRKPLKRLRSGPVPGTRKKRPKDKPSRLPRALLTHRQERSLLRSASSSPKATPPQLDFAGAGAEEVKGARDGSISPQATSTTLVTGRTTIHSRNGMVTVNMSGFNAGSESPSSASSRTLASPQTIETTQPITPLSSSETYEAIGDIYRRHMELKKKGRHALWAPQPYLQLPLEYRRGGTQIGDVGIITQEGAFDFMFNICGAITQGSNVSANLPVGIVPIHPPVIWEREITIVAEHSARDALTSQGVSKRILPNGEFIFTCTQPNGVILVLPDGSVTERLLNYRRFQKYYAQNAEAWYTFALATRGPDVRNGDLHLVYGCEKTTEWGIAEFDNPHRGKQSAEHRLRNMGEDWRKSAGTPYGWEHTDRARSKVGPRDRELRELGASRDEPLRNQTLFIQSINTTLREEDWKRITDAVSMDVSMDFGSSELSSAGSLSAGPSFTSADPSSQSQLQGSTRAPSMSRDFNSISTPRKQPSQVLNEYLLNQYPEAKVAAIASEVWSHVEDECLDAPEMLITAVLATYSPVLDTDGLASFVNSADRDATPEPVVADGQTISSLHHSLQGSPIDILGEASSSQSPLILEAAPDDVTNPVRESLSSFSEKNDERSRNIESNTHSERGQGNNTQRPKSQNQRLMGSRRAKLQNNHTPMSDTRDCYPAMSQPFAEQPVPSLSTSVLETSPGPWLRKPRPKTLRGKLTRGPESLQRVEGWQHAVSGWTPVGYYKRTRETKSHADLRAVQKNQAGHDTAAGNRGKKPYKAAPPKEDLLRPPSTQSTRSKSAILYYTDSDAGSSLPPSPFSTTSSMEPDDDLSQTIVLEPRDNTRRPPTIQTAASAQRGVMYQNPYGSVYNAVASESSLSHLMGEGSMPDLMTDSPSSVIQREGSTGSMSSVLMMAESPVPMIFAPHDFNRYGPSSSAAGPNGSASVPMEGQNLPSSINRHEVTDATQSTMVDDISEPDWQTVNRVSEGYVREGSGFNYVDPTVFYAIEPLFMPQDGYFGFPPFENESRRY